jgi:hypothetical protein
VRRQTLYELYSSNPQAIGATFQRMGYLRLETATLGQVDDTYYYGVSCSSCHRSKHLSLVKLRSVLGADYPLVELRKRLKCSTCGRRQLPVMFLAPGQSGTSLQHLFQRPAV